MLEAEICALNVAAMREAIPIWGLKAKGKKEDLKQMLQDGMGKSMSIVDAPLANVKKLPGLPSGSKWNFFHQAHLLSSSLQMTVTSGHLTMIPTSCQQLQKTKTRCGIIQYLKASPKTRGFFSRDFVAMTHSS